MPVFGKKHCHSPRGLEGPGAVEGPSRPGGLEGGPRGLGRHPKDQLAAPDGVHLRQGAFPSLDAPHDGTRWVPTRDL